MRRLKWMLFGTLVLSICCLSGCFENFNFGAGLNDWTFESLPGNYRVVRSNSRSIFLAGSPSSAERETLVIDTYISEIAYTSDYIFVQQVSVPEDNRTPIDTSNPVYFILSASDGVLEGPYSKEDFTAAYEALGLKEEPDWITSTKLRDLIENEDDNEPPFEHTGTVFSDS